MNDQVTSQETAELLRLAEQCLDVPGDFVELGCYRGDTSVLLGKLLQKTSYPVSASRKKTSTACEKLPTSCGKTVEKFHKSTNNLSQNVEKHLIDCGEPMESPPKHLWLYDSFAGLPEKTREDNSGAGANFQAGKLFVTKREVTDKLRRAGLKITTHPDPTTSTIIIKKAWFDQLTTQNLPDKIAFAFLDGDLYESIKTSLQLVAPRLAPQGIMVVHDYNNPELPGSSRAVDEWLHQNQSRNQPQGHNQSLKQAQGQNHNQISNYHLQVKYSLAILRRK